MNRNRISMSMIFGLILVSVGIISLLGSLGYLVSWDIFSTYWPLVIILLGLRHIINPGGGKLWGLILIAVGVLLQLEILNIFIINRSLMRDMAVPVIIILIGLRFMLPGRRKDRQEVKKEVASEIQKAPVQDVKAKEVKEAKAPERSVEETVKEEVKEVKPDLEDVPIETVEVETVEVIVDQVRDRDEHVIEIDE